jgi:hypothetical protein
LQNITNNLPEAFTNYKGVTKSHKPAANVPERVEILTQNVPNQNKRGRTMVTKGKTSKQHPRKQRKNTSKMVNANQHHVDRHQMDIENPNSMDIPRTNVHTIISARTSKNLDSSTLGNIEETQRVNEISTNYIDSRESFNRKTIIVDINSPLRLQLTFNLIQNLRQWQSASSAPTGSNGTKQSR